MVSDHEFRKLNIASETVAEVAKEIAEEKHRKGRVIDRLMLNIAPGRRRKYKFDPAAAPVWEKIDVIRAKNFDKELLRSFDSVRDCMDRWLAAIGVAKQQEAKVNGTRAEIQAIESKIGMCCAFGTLNRV